MNNESETFHDEVEEYEEEVRAPEAPRGRDRQADAAEEQDEKEREEAFDQVPMWRGKPLLAWSLERERFFHSHRCAAGAPRLSRAVDDWDAFLLDALRILYFCHHEPEDFIGMGRDPMRLEAEIQKWGSEQVPRELEDEARVVAMRILAAARRNEHEPAPAGIRRKADAEGN